MERERPNLWFFAAWLLLVAVVAFGFWVQARTIRRLNETQRIQQALICATYEHDKLASFGIECPA